MTTLSNILIVRGDGIGDEIFSLPVASALRRALPAARIAFLASAHAAPMLEHHPDLDEVVTINGRERFRDLVALFRRGYDAAVFLKPFRHLMIASWAARVPIRVATGFRWYSIFMNRRVYEHRHHFAKHETEYNLALLKGLGLSPKPAAPPRLTLTEEERVWGRARVEALPQPRVIIHPGGFAARRWSGARYWELAERLAGEGFGVVLTGSGAERERFQAEAAISSVKPPLLDLMGQLTLRQLMAVIAASQALVSTATGPAHMAGALDVPTVAIYDPRRMNLPIRWGPIGRGYVLRPDVPTCEHCSYEACPYWDCLDRITIDQVVMRVRDVVRAPTPMLVLHV